MLYLAVDIGSTHIKIALIEVPTGRVIAIQKRPSPARLNNPNPRIFEIEADQYVHVVRQALEQSIQTHGEVEGVLLSTQMHGFVLSQTNACPVYISWQDCRCLDAAHKELSYLEKLRSDLPQDQFKDCGVILKPSLGLCNLFAKKQMEHWDDQPRVLDTLGSYIIFCLTGKHVCHISNAAPLGFLDLKRRIWNQNILAALDLRAISLPQIAADEFHPCATAVILGQTVKVYPDYGDQQVSILGSYANGKDAVINIATAAQVSVFTNAFESTPFEIRPYFEQTYIHTISNMPSGRNLEVLHRFVQNVVETVTQSPCSLESIRQVIQHQVHEAAPSLQVDTGFFPTQGDCKGGSITGIFSANLTMDGLFSAAYSHMAESYWQNLRSLRSATDIESIVCAGGVSWHNAQLLHRIQEVTQKPCRRCVASDEAIAGLFRIAMCCAGYAKELVQTSNYMLQIC